MYPSLSSLDACVYDWVYFMGERKRGATTLSVLSLKWKALLWTDTCYIAPLHTGLDEGKWPFNRHDSHFDWELCPKASTLPASKASQRLCSASSSPVAVVFFGLFCNALPSVSNSSWHLETGLPVSFVSPEPTHPLLLTVLLLLWEVMLMWAWLVKEKYDVYASLFSSIPSSLSQVCVWRLETVYKLLRVLENTLTSYGTVLNQKLKLWLHPRH